MRKAYHSVSKLLGFVVELVIVRVASKNAGVI